MVSNHLGRSTDILEKDVWVVWSLQTLFTSAMGEHLIFKGGTSLSKAYDVIRRFSEDVDLTYDIRAIAPDLVGDDGEALPPSRSQEKRWTKEARHRLAEWVEGAAKPYLQNAISDQGLSAKVRSEEHKIFIDYKPTSTDGIGYVVPIVTLEFGARSTGEPCALRDVKCDMDGFVDGVVFPTARPRVMHAERTFWEKITATHVFCLQRRLRAERFARHWHDLVRLDDAGIADIALRDRALADSVVKHKAMFFRMKASDGEYIDYGDVINGNLQLVPSGDARSALEGDYRYMIESDFFLDEVETFDALIDRCADIEKRANRMALESV
ncbi:nucleotidyl transferase AbiEii/AbiGii toxin family protein [Thioalkalivibrio sp. HK1]|uniref:nucleotidyl transferase AbiEii/AbiGii toxin family protein n=1 Tax=Thioalkalivibrio sp. HK1 TaxID=1469245 RepID=UPI001E5868B4|nr:nucleotidyl transferase AbiEii/AbiGii toxin family protein [Thioalkalivibrio sp. HK1]